MSSIRASQSSPYLFRSRHGVWYARVVVPEDQRDALGKRELRKSLLTRDKLEAVRRSWDVLKSLRLLAEGKALSNPTTSAQNTCINTSPSNESVVEHLEVASRIPPRTPKLPKLSLIADEYCKEKMLVGAWSKQSEYINRKTFKDLIALLGDLTLCQVTKEKAHSYKQHYTSKAELSVTTINKYLSRTSALLEWASSHYGSLNPMAGMTFKVAAKVKASKERQALSPNRIQQLFREIPETTELTKFPYRAWLPRLAAYTGARLGELAQLYLDDFDVVDGYPCILIRASRPDQSLKTSNSERTIPIHPRLIELGFLQYVEHQRANGHERLFPEIKREPVRGYSHPVSRWFTKFKAEMGWTEKETFHGIRHSVVTLLKREEFSSEMVAELLGHSHGSITFDRYGKDYGVGQMLRLVEAIDWFNCD